MVRISGLHLRGLGSPVNVSLNVSTTSTSKSEFLCRCQRFMSVDSEHSTESTVTINPFIYSAHHYWMGPVVESVIVTGIERALLGSVLELELMFC